MKFYAIFLASILITSSLGLSNFDNAFAEKTHYKIWVEEYPIQFYPISDPLSWSIEFWEKARPDLSFSVVSEQTDGDILIFLIKEKGGHWRGLATGRALFVEYGDSNCSGDWKPRDSILVGKTMAHEIGHALGYGHEEQSDSIMSTKSVNKYSIETPPFNLPLKKGLSLWMPLCSIGNAGAIHYDISDPENKHRFDFYIASSVDDASDFISGTLPPNEYDSECGGRDVIKKTGLCKLDSGMILALISKSESHDVRLEFKPQDVRTLQYYVYSEKPISPWVHPKESIPKNSIPTCGPGTVLQNGLCVVDPNKPSQPQPKIYSTSKQTLEPEPTCGPGTVLKNGVCVVESIHSNESGEKEVDLLKQIIQNIQDFFSSIFG